MRRRSGEGQGLRLLAAPRGRGLGASRAALVCCPHAGGSASFFRPWLADMPEALALFALQYPGREERLSERCCDDMSMLVASLLPELDVLQDTPYVLFGHSMGAAVAFELCSRLEQRGNSPDLLMVSSHPPPDEVAQSDLHTRDDLALWEEMVRLGGTSPLILQEAELRRLLTPALRGDYRLMERYRPSQGARLSTPLLVCLGDADPEVPADRVAGWQRFTQHPIRVLKRPGGHFYLTEHRRDLIAVGARALRVEVSGRDERAGP